MSELGHYQVVWANRSGGIEWDCTDARNGLDALAQVRKANLKNWLHMKDVQIRENCNHGVPEYMMRSRVRRLSTEERRTIKFLQGKRKWLTRLREDGSLPYL